MARQIRGVAPNGTVSWEGEVSNFGVVRDLEGVSLPTAEEVLRFGLRPGTECRIRSAGAVTAYKLSAAFVWEVVVAGPPVLPAELDWIGLRNMATLNAELVEPCRVVVVAGALDVDVLTSNAPVGVPLTIVAKVGGTFRHETGTPSVGPPHQALLMLEDATDFTPTANGSLTIIYRGVAGSPRWYEIARTPGAGA